MLACARSFTRFLRCVCVCVYVPSVATLDTPYIYSRTRKAVKIPCIYSTQKTSRAMYLLRARQSDKAMGECSIFVCVCVVMRTMCDIFLWSLAIALILFPMSNMCGNACKDFMCVCVCLCSAVVVTKAFNATIEHRARRDMVWANATTAAQGF